MAPDGRSDKGSHKRAEARDILGDYHGAYADQVNVKPDEDRRRYSNCHHQDQEVHTAVLSDSGKRLDHLEKSCSDRRDREQDQDCEKCGHWGLLQYDHNSRSALRQSVHAHQSVVGFVPHSW